MKDDIRNIRSFMFHREWWEALSELTDDERLSVYDAAVNYAFTGAKTTMRTSGARVAIRMIESTIDADKEHKASVNAIYRANGKRGGRPKKNVEKNQAVLDNTYDNQQDNATDLLFDLPPIDPTMVKKTAKKAKPTPTDDKDLFESCWVAYGRKGVKKPAFTQWVKLSPDDRRKAERHIPFYVKSTERQYQKDFERYLLHRVFESPVYERNTGALIYDPTRSESSDTYTPEVGPTLVWNDDNQCYMYIGFWNGYIPDGYKDDERPDGAVVILNNGRGMLTWKSGDRKWELR